MVLSCLILCSVILCVLFFCVFSLMTGDYSVVKTFKFMFCGKHEEYIMFNIFMSLLLFLVMFLASAATYNTYIDKSNPHYFKKV
jgi:hypothetical protein